jgi:hypothetical protein
VSALFTNDDRALAFPDTSDCPSVFFLPANSPGTSSTHATGRNFLKSRSCGFLTPAPLGCLGAADASDRRPRLCPRIIGRHSFYRLLQRTKVMGVFDSNRRQVCLFSNVFLNSPIYSSRISSKPAVVTCFITVSSDGLPQRSKATRSAQAAFASTSDFY